MDKSEKPEKSEKPDKPKRKIEGRGFKVTLGRFVDIVIIFVSLVIIIFSLLGFVTMATVFALGTYNSPGDNECILFATANNSNIVFGSNGPCIIVLITPVIIWATIISLIVFLIGKIFRAFNMCFMVYVWTFILALLFLFTLAVSILLSIGEQRTCAAVLTLAHPLGGNQDCSQGGAYYNTLIGSDGFFRFDDLVDTTEVGLWISVIFIFSLFVLYLLRCIWWTFRILRGEKKSSKA